MANKNPKQTKEFLEHKGKIQNIKNNYNKTQGKAQGKTVEQLGAEKSNQVQKIYRDLKTMFLEEDNKDGFNLRLLMKYKQQLDEDKRIPYKDIKDFFELFAKITGQMQQDNQITINNNNDAKLDPKEIQKIMKDLEGDNE